MFIKNLTLPNALIYRLTLMEGALTINSETDFFLCSVS